MNHILLKLRYWNALFMNLYRCLKVPPLCIVHEHIMTRTHANTSWNIQYSGQYEGNCKSFGFNETTQTI